jgi:hypothetical protein
MKKVTTAGLKRLDIRQLTALTVGALVLLACTLVESIEIKRDGSGTTRLEFFLEPSETSAVDDVRAGIQENLRKDPKMRLVAEGPRNGGHFFLVERSFANVTELNDENATYRWEGDGQPSATTDRAGTPLPIASLFVQRYRLEMNLGAQDYGPARATMHQLEVRMPGPITDTNGQIVGTDKVVWDRLSPKGQGALFAVSRTRRIPRPSEIADWFVLRHRDRYFDDNGLVWLADEKLWTGGLDGGNARSIAEAGGFDRLIAGGHRGLLYRADEWFMATPQDVRIVDLNGSEPPREIKGVTSPSLSPDGRLLAFGRVRAIDARRKSTQADEEELEGLWVRHLDTGEEELIAGELDLPRPRGGRRSGPSYRTADPGKWQRDFVTWSSDGRQIWLQRWYLNYEIAVYVADVGTANWRPVSCDGSFGYLVVAASNERVVANMNPESHAYYDVCDVESGRSLARKSREWSGLFRDRYLMDFAFSPGGQLAFVAAPFTEEGWPGDPAEIWLGDPRPQRIVEHSEGAAGIRWHPRENLLLYGNRLVDPGERTTKLLDGEVTNPQWAQIARGTFPSVAATRALLMAGAWLVLALSAALIAGTGWAVARAVLRKTRGRRDALRCERCGHAIVPGARFCGSCGASRAGADAEQRGGD